MKLFNPAQINKIKEVADKSKAAFEPPSKSSKTKTMNQDIERISKEVEDYFKDSPAILITTKEELHQYILDMIDCGIGGVDCETTGLDRIHDHVVGFSLYCETRPECYIPNKHLIPLFDQPYSNQLTYEEVHDELLFLLNSDVKLVYANADFDLAMMRKDYGVDLSPRFFYDVILSWRCLKENEPDNRLKILYNKYPLKGKGNPKTFSDFFPVALFPYCKPNVARLYAANDPKLNIGLMRWQLPYCDKNNIKCQKNGLEAIADLIWNLEMPLVKVCHSLHHTGIHLDRQVASVIRARYRGKYEIQIKKLQSMVQDVIDKSGYIPSFSENPPFTQGSQFNPDSAPQVRHLITKILKLPLSKDGGTGKEYLSTLNNPVLDQILVVRSLKTLIGTFTDKMLEIVAPDGRIHATFKQIGADCIVGDSIIPTSCGYKLMCEICESENCLEGEHVDVDDLVIFNKDQQLETVRSVIRYTDYPTIKIVTECGFEIEGTYNHPIMVSKYTASDNVTRGDSRLESFWDERRFKRLDEISVGDFVEIPCNYEIKGEYQHTHLELEVAKTWTRKSAKIPKYYNEDFALLLGMYHADGASYVREGTYTLAISNDSDDVISEFKRLASCLFNLTVVIYDKQIAVNEVESYINCVQLKGLDKILSHGKQSKKIPKPIWASPVSVINCYIKGMTLDSSVYRDENGRAAFELSIIDPQDARLVQIHLASQGILCYLGWNENKDGWRSPRLGFNADNYMLFRDKIGFIERNKIIDTIPCGKNKYDARRIDNSFRLKVKSISESRNTVYDFNVPGTHSFISNGFISHNTGRFSSSDPNMQNIPSHNVDIRHMFRATPEGRKKYKMRDVPVFEGRCLEVSVPNYYSFYTDQGLVKVSDAYEGLLINVLRDDVKDKLKITSIKESKEDISCLDIRFHFDSSTCIDINAKLWEIWIYTPRYIMMSSDYSAQEPRLTAYVSNDATMINSFKEGKDIYATIASVAFGYPYEQCLEFHPVTGEYQPDGKSRRSEAKSVLLGICYGRSVPSVGDQLYGHDDTLSDKEKTEKAQKVFDAVLTAIPGLRDVMNYSQKFAEKYGYVETILGRRRHLPDMQLPEFQFVPMEGYVNPDIDPLDPSTLDNEGGIPKRIQESLLEEFTGLKHFGQIVKRSKKLAEEYHIKVINNRPKINDARRQCLNSRIQGSAADQTKMAMLLIDNCEQWEKLGARLLIPVHDELIAEAPVDNYEEAGELLSSLMCEAASFLPFESKCDVETTLRWYGLEYPCPFTKPESISSFSEESMKELSDNDISWIQYCLTECEYQLPVYKNPDGSKPNGIAAKGVNGVPSDYLSTCIVNYMEKYGITESQFLDHIEHLVFDGTLENNRRYD